MGFGGSFLHRIWVGWDGSQHVIHGHVAINGYHPKTGTFASYDKSTGTPYIVLTKMIDANTWTPESKQKSFSKRKNQLTVSPSLCPPNSFMAQQEECKPTAPHRQRRDFVGNLQNIAEHRDSYKAGGNSGTFHCLLRSLIQILNQQVWAKANHQLLLHRPASITPGYPTEHGVQNLLVPRHLLFANGRWFWGFTLENSRGKVGSNKT